jgi:hypothetical protein
LDLHLQVTSGSQQIRPEAYNRSNPRRALSQPRENPTLQQIAQPQQHPPLKPISTWKFAGISMTTKAKRSRRVKTKPSKPTVRALLLMVPTAKLLRRLWKALQRLQRRHLTASLAESTVRDYVSTMPNLLLYRRTRVRRKLSTICAPTVSSRADSHLPIKLPIL